MCYGRGRARYEQSLKSLLPGIPTARRWRSLRWWAFFVNRLETGGEGKAESGKRKEEDNRKIEGQEYAEDGNAESGNRDDESGAKICHCPFTNCH